MQLYYVFKAIPGGRAEQEVRNSLLKVFILYKITPEWMKKVMLDWVDKVLKLLSSTVLMGFVPYILWESCKCYLMASVKAFRWSMLQVGTLDFTSQSVCDHQSFKNQVSNQESGMIGTYAHGTFCILNTNMNDGVRCCCVSNISSNTCICSWMMNMLF